MKFPAFLLLAFAFVTMLHAQDLAPELVPLAAKYAADSKVLEAERTATVARVAATYRTALEGTEKTVTSAGNLKASAAIVREKAAIEDQSIEEAFPVDLPKSLQGTRKSYFDGVTRANTDLSQRQQRVDADYLRALGALETRAPANSALAKQITQEKKELLERPAPGDVAALCGVLWKNHQDTLEFLRNGKFIQHGTGWEGGTWKFVNSKTLELVFANTQRFTYRFERGVPIHPDPAWGAYTKQPKGSLGKGASK